MVSSIFNDEIEREIGLKSELARREICVGSGGYFLQRNLFSRIFCIKIWPRVIKVTRLVDDSWAVSRSSSNPLKCSIGNCLQLESGSWIFPNIWKSKVKRKNCKIVSDANILKTFKFVVIFKILWIGGNYFRIPLGYLAVFEIFSDFLDIANLRV